MVLVHTSLGKEQAIGMTVLHQLHDGLGDLVVVDTTQPRNHFSEEIELDVHAPLEQAFHVGDISSYVVCMADDDPVQVRSL